jgi:hypothetical protein
VTIHIWDIRSPDGGSTGLPFARGRMVASMTVLGHALPSSIDVEVRDEDGTLVASAHELKGEERTPMALLQIDDKDVIRTQLWPSDEDLGTPVILPGGEVGILTAWWHSPDHSEWRWSIELQNRARTIRAGVSAGPEDSIVLP